MKRFFSVFITLVMVVSLICPVFAASVTETTLHFNLTANNGKNQITVPTGTTIEVTFTLENKTESKNFNIQSFTNEIIYNNSAFEFVKFTNNAEGVRTSTPSDFDHSKKVYFNGIDEPRAFDKNQKVGSFELKVLAPNGTTHTIATAPKEATAFYGDFYKNAITDLVVYVGETPPTEYTLTFETNGGTAISPVTRYENTVLSLDSYLPTKDGNTFGGWYADSGLTQAVTSVTLDSNKKVYAKWTANSTPTPTPPPGGGGGGGGGGGAVSKKFTLTFETNGGSEIAAKSIAEKTVVNLANYKTIKKDCTFAGWYLDERLSQPATALTMTKDTTIYAAWTKGEVGSSVAKVMLSFEENGGSEVNDTPKVKNTTVDLSKYITSRSGYSFDGWHTDNELKSRVTSVKMESDITLYAKWVKGDNGYKPNPNYKPDIFTTEHIAYIIGRDGGYIAPNDNLTRAEAATMFYRLIDPVVLEEGKATTNSFNDVNEGDWFNTAISTLANLEVLNGRTANTFEPNATITRAEFMTIVARLSEAPYDGEDLFTDISQHWARNYINIAASINWAKGDNGLFRPNDNITRAEAMTIINRATSRLPENTSDLLDGMTVFVDNMDPNVWYYLNIQEATNSHNYGRKADGVHEKWTGLTEAPDWAK